MHTKNNNSLSSKSINIIQKSKICHHKCKICEAPALHSNFGAITCSACKIFFKRNAEKGQEEFKCDFSNNCQINVNTRHVCTACRLAKCFAYGMQIELIRCSISKKNSIKQKYKTESSIITSNILVPTLNLLQSDQSILSTDQWNHISNLVHYYDEYGVFSITERFASEQNGLPIKLRYKFGPIGELITLIMSKIQQIFNKNSDYLSLCSEDRSTLIHTTVKHTAGFGGLVVLHQTKLLDDPFFFKNMEILFGLGVMKASKDAANYLDYDITFIKLIIAALSFSTTNYTVFKNSTAVNFIDIKTILHIQDKYIELAWKYMVYKYSYEHAVRRFSQLLRSLFHCHRAIVEADEVEQYINMIDSVVERTEQTLFISDN